MLIPVFPILSLASAQQPLLEREFRFKLLARIEVGSSVAGLILAVVLATNGAGVYSLVAQTLASYALSTAQVWLRPLGAHERGWLGRSCGLF